MPAQLSAAHSLRRNSAQFSDAHSITRLSRYNPLGKSQLREVFLKTDNAVHGRYFAELTAELFDDLAESKYQHAENRISIYGRDREEWDELAAWVVDHKLYSPHNRWLIQVLHSPRRAAPRPASRDARISRPQVPRLYGMYKERGLLNSFQELLDNLFAPLFEVSIDPNSHPKLHLMLQQVVG